jgi:SAM-dependent methyltransferase
MMTTVRKRLGAFIAKNQFHPSIAGVWVNPFWLDRRALYKSLCEYAPRLAGAVLDFGCGTGPYRGLLTSATKYTGLEYDSPHNRQHKQADIFYDGITIPLEDGSMDNVLSTQTIEHVSNPDRIVAEWRRILRPGGKLLLTAPFMGPEHEMPYDFQRYTTNGLRNLLEENGFEVLAQERLLCDCRALAQLFLAWLYDVLRLGSRKPITRCILTALLFAPASLAATVLAAVAPVNSNTYLNNMIFAKRV